MTVYDITPCFIGHDHIRRFQMAFPGTYKKYYDNDPAQFKLWVQDGITIYLDIPLIRLQHLEVDTDVITVYTFLIQ